MEIKTIIEKEDKNKNLIILHKEGIFAKAYNQSAFLLSKMKTLKKSCRYIKSIKQHVISVGMPYDKALELLKDLEKEKNDDKTLTVKTTETIQPEEYKEWITQTINEMKDIQGNTNENEIISAIREFDIINKTPYDCLVFVKTLKSKL